MNFALTLSDSDVWKILCLLAGCIGHLYWESYRCRKGREATKDRVARLEKTIAACPAENCPLQQSETSSGGKPVMGFCLRSRITPTK